MSWEHRRDVTIVFWRVVDVAVVVVDAQDVCADGVQADAFITTRMLLACHVGAWEAQVILVSAFRRLS